MVWVGDEEVLVCRSCYTEYTEGIRLFFNGLRKLNGKAPKEFKDYMR